MNDMLWRPILSGGKDPFYKQLVDSILIGVDKGLLTPNTRLPTVRDLAEKMNLSGGTIKHAYDELERLGVIEKVRGRGTFIRFRDNEQALGKKDRAMRLIDGFINEMQELGFSLRETQIFLDLKMREREDRPLSVHVTVIDCNPETLYIISDQVAQIRDAEVTYRLLDDISGELSLMEDEPDIIVTTSNHYERVASAAREGQVSRVVLSPSQDTVAKLAKLGENDRVGILTSSERFARLIRETRAELVADGVDGEDTPYILFGTDRIEEFTRTLDTIIVPNRYARFCLPREINTIRAFQEAGGNIIEFVYHIDAGSLMYLEQQIAHIFAQKSTIRL
jgi:DNA-binding transcriptional regulator YhcF (GntR family)